MKKFFILLVSAFIFCACGDDDKVYEFIEIQYLQGDGNMVERFKENVSSKTYTNEDNEPMTIDSFEFNETFNNSSVFEIKTALPKDFVVRDGILVSVPDETGKISNLKKIFNLTPQNSKCEFYYMVNPFRLEPKTELTYEFNALGYKQKAQFKVSFKEVNSGEIFELYGEWSNTEYQTPEQLVKRKALN